MQDDSKFGGQGKDQDGPQVSDLFIIGGGINGCGIARDAAGRGLSVTLAEMGDLASATSSASTKLFHGGLRYLEYLELRLVREALIEREVLLRAMPHISWPMRFVLPYHKDMRFESDTPVSRMLARVLPWMKGRRPAWMIRAALFLYDRLGGRGILPATRRVDLRHDPAGAPLQDRFEKAFEYSDCWVDDARLVVLNARDAAARGARILTRHKVVATTRHADHWEVVLQDAQGRTHLYRARVLVNAAGPWAGQVLDAIAGVPGRARVRLVRGSHIVVPRLYDHDRCYFFQGEDGRIIFAIPYEGAFTLIGTTDQEHGDAEERPECSAEEVDYLCAFASRYFKVPVEPADVVWTYSGVRPLYDDGAGSATAATRDYVLDLVEEGGAPVLNVFGGKITTYRRLAEAALARLSGVLAGTGGAWTAGVALPGGDFPVEGRAALVAELERDYPFLGTDWAERLVRIHGTQARDILGLAQSGADLGQSFGATLSEAEVSWMMRHEYARTAEDVVWRRTKLGLRMSAEEIAALEAWMAGANTRST
ncbi:MAG: glycerol-3-phosphate dehydrogenase [Rhodobacterales bacterium]|nr:MAG: glycerol-3-phosphate dehydrogenase [Rhodobacterales bacterium]